MNTDYTGNRHWQSIPVEEIKYRLENELPPKRFIHSINVMNIAVKLAARYGENKESAEVAGLLHDYARDFNPAAIFELCSRYGITPDPVSLSQPELLHGPVCAHLIAEEFGIDDDRIIDAIKYHTTGRANMSALEKIIFISDFIEPDRIFPGVDEIRKTAFNDIDRAVIMALDSTIRFIIKKGGLIHPDSVDARNYLISCCRSRNYQL